MNRYVAACYGRSLESSSSDVSERVCVFSFSISFPEACRLKFPFVLVTFFAEPFFFCVHGADGGGVISFILFCQHSMFAGAAADLGGLWIGEGIQKPWLTAFTRSIKIRFVFLVSFSISFKVCSVVPVFCSLVA